MRRRRLLVSFALFAPATVATACDVCVAEQPKILQGVTHGAGPQGNIDYVIVALAAALVVYTLVHAIKCLVRPGETDAAHIKRVILNED